MHFRSTGGDISFPCPQNNCAFDTRQRKVPGGELVYEITESDMQELFRLPEGAFSGVPFEKVDEFAQSRVKIANQIRSRPLFDICMEHGAQGQQPSREEAKRIIIALFRRIGDQPDLAAEWSKMPNAERNCLAGAFYNIIWPDAFKQGQQYQCPAAEFTSEEGIIICNLKEGKTCPKQIHVPDNEEPLCESQPMQAQPQGQLALLEEIIRARIMNVMKVYDGETNKAITDRPFAMCDGMNEVLLVINSIQQGKHITGKQTQPLICGTCGHRTEQRARTLENPFCKECDYRQAQPQDAAGNAEPASSPDREMMIQWIETFSTDSVKELKDALIWRLKDGLFAPPLHPMFKGYSAGFPNPASPGKASDVLTNKPKVICLCGSTRFTREMLIKQWELTKQGYIVLTWCALPDDYYQGEEKAHIGDQEGVKVAIDELHKRKIDLSDEVFVINIDGYIGTSTRSEIDYAVSHGKPVKYLESALRQVQQQ